MRILLVTWGTEGDTRPVLALAKGLRDAGHDPLVLADRAGAVLAADLGVAFEPMPGDFRELMGSESTSMGEVSRTGRTTASAWPELVRDFARPALTLVQDRLDGMDLLIGSSMCKVPCEVIARRQGVPMLGIDLQPFTPTREFPPPLLGTPRLPPVMNLPLYGAMNATFGLVRQAFLAPMVPRRAPLRHGRLPQLGAWSPTLVPRPREWAADWPVVTGELRLPASDLEPDQELVDFLAAGDAPVFVGLGSMAGVDMSRFRATAAEALQGRRAVFSAGWSTVDDTDFGDSVLPIGPASFDWLFPRCSVLVHHAGAGTAHLAARSGRPSVCVPQIADQAFWASQFQKLGVAPAPVDRDTVTAAQLRAAVADADTRQQRAQQVAEAMAGEDGVRDAIAWIESHRGELRVA